MFCAPFVGAAKSPQNLAMSESANVAKVRAILDFCSGLLRRLPFVFTDASSVAKLRSFATVAFTHISTSYGSIERSVGSGLHPLQSASRGSVPGVGLVVEEFNSQRAFGSRSALNRPGYQHHSVEVRVEQSVPIFDFLVPLQTERLEVIPTRWACEEC